MTPLCPYRSFQTSTFAPMACGCSVVATERSAHLYRPACLASMYSTESNPAPLCFTDLVIT